VRPPGGHNDRVRAVGAAVAGVAAVAAVSEAVARGGAGPPTAFVALVTLAAVAPVALVRLWPATAAVLSAVATVAGLLVSCPVTVAGAAVLAALHGVAGHRCRAGVVVALPLPLLAYAALPMSIDRPGGRSVALALLGVAVLSGGTGTALRLRAQWHRHRDSERSAAASRVEHAARGERARIARELHDVVAHHITMVALQAEAARLATPGLPPEAARRLVAIGDTARTALTEMRRLLGVLRADAAPDAVLQPQPGLAQLNGLLDEIRDAARGGVRLIVSGAVEPLDPGLELTAYRIVQEALTNTRRHAPDAAVDVELRYGRDELVLRVYDNGPGPRPDDGGGIDGRHGLAGMRERAAMVGGRLRTGPGPAIGFLVEAVLPRKGGAA
jgi:signal transduction histidine kinase